jgi:asparagine synthase (glutamine-hydrolysing)
VCGICGIALRDPQSLVDEQSVKRMADSLIHRGPDDEGFYSAPGIGLGVRRLSIIDLQTGNQPISNEDGTVVVVCNGEIYNFKEQREKLEHSGHRFRTTTDVEVIVHLYEELGPDFVRQLRGMFGLALWDQRRKRLMLARDRLGIKPLFYALHEQTLFFGSELKAILTASKLEREIDVHGLRDLFRAGFVMGSRTLFRNIRRLLPGHFLLYQNGMTSIHRYWEPSFPLKGEPVPKKPDREWAEILRTKLQETIKLHLRSDVPLGAFLSGGIDSSAVASLMSQLYEHPVHTFSLGFENHNLDEIGRQKILSDFEPYHLLKHTTICKTQDIELLKKSVWHREDPTPILLDIPLLLLSELAARSVKAVLTGEGSDEVFGGYSWFRRQKLLHPLMKLPRSMRKSIARLPGIRNDLRASNSLGAPAKMDLTRYLQLIRSANRVLDERVFSEPMGDLLRVSATQMPDLPSNFEQWHRFAQLQYFDMTIRLPDFIIRNLDSASMAYSLEARVPFLDHELVEFCATIPPDLKMRGLREKYILRRALQNDLPREIIRRKKRGLMPPYAQWSRNLPEFALELLSERAIRNTGYFNPGFVAEMLKSCQSGDPAFAKSLMCVVGVQVWSDLFKGRL